MSVESLELRGGILDDLNCAKVFMGLYEGAKPGGKFENREKAAFYMAQMQRAAKGLAEHKAKYSIAVPNEDSPVNGGWMHKATDNPEKSYWGQMWCDGAYMGPALLAQLRSSRIPPLTSSFSSPSSRLSAHCASPRYHASAQAESW